MTNAIFSFSLMVKVLQTLVKRSIGLRKYPNWSIKTEIIWATSRMTLLASNKYGLSWLKGFSKRMAPALTSNKEVKIIEEICDDTRYLKIFPNDVRSQRKTIIYFHGGGYVLGSPEVSSGFLTQLSKVLKILIWVPDYPKAPEERYPKAQIESLSFVKELIKTNGNPILMGDSAGAALVLSVYHGLTIDERKSIFGTILISPWIEPLATSGSMNYNSDNDIGDRTFVTNCYQLYLGDKSESAEYPMSFNATNIPSLPKTFIGVGTAEILLDQSRELNDSLTNIGSEVSLKLYQNMFHTFWNHPSSIPEAYQLIKDISVWLANK